MMVELDTRKILVQAGVKERMAVFDLPTLQDDFYKITKEYINNLQEPEKIEMQSMLNSIFQARKNKIAKLAEAVNEDPKLKEKMTPEEKEYFDNICAATILFKESIL